MVGRRHFPTIIQRAAIGRSFAMLHVVIIGGSGVQKASGDPSLHLKGIISRFLSNAAAGHLFNLK